jgi:hypothetical protein
MLIQFNAEEVEFKSFARSSVRLQESDSISKSTFPFLCGVQIGVSRHCAVAA